MLPSKRQQEWQAAHPIQSMLYVSAACAACGTVVLNLNGSDANPLVVFGLFFVFFLPFSAILAFALRRRLRLGLPTSRERREVERERERRAGW